MRAGLEYSDGTIADAHNGMLAFIIQCLAITGSNTCQGMQEEAWWREILCFWQ